MNQSLQNHPFHIEKNTISAPNDNAKQDFACNMTDDEKINAAAERILNQYRAAFEELAK